MGPIDIDVCSLPVNNVNDLEAASVQQQGLFACRCMSALVLSAGLRAFDVEWLLCQAARPIVTSMVGHYAFRIVQAEEHQMHVQCLAVEAQGLLQRQHDVVLWHYIQTTASFKINLIIPFTAALQTSHPFKYARISASPKQEHY